MFLIVLALIFSFLVSYLVTPVTINFFKKRGWVENPAEKQAKTGNATALYPVPRGGGLPIFLAISLFSLLFLPKDTHLISITVAGLLTLIVGLVDDVVDISPFVRLVSNILSSLVVIGSGVTITFLSNPFGVEGSVVQLNTAISIFLTVAWIVWCTNIVGWSAGIEGQMAGFVSISAVFLGILGLRFSADTTQWPVIILAMSIAGAYAGFLPYNFYPQKIMPGYSGKSLAGFYLSVLAILSGTKLATLIILLAVPMSDAVLVIFRRLKNRKPIYQGDGQHLHHLLLKKGFRRSQIAVFYWLLSFITGATSLFLNSRQKLYFLIIFGIIFSVFILQLSRNNLKKPSR